ncbi:oligosaccharide flippase family protein [Bradyrhizobium sp. YCK136]|uniref:oligosaccharide flippase family protein n=1 Tax=Bradyrhizobium TaxID=374 RepID=UPI001B8D4B80|nr:oligosaccharide flippase family protein [Bradyrhizobium diazoefficiens]MBR0868328.1 oligosaccharide flippase family protein [Bradyrhizobium diazoefficiens]MBR0892107.1 oligosaccharide flippase family protein [Bradyrhizobium diazoefficiens]MBR0924520.1 oligosaccharide flippase family protein [Bradyrhizobium diazoefficiens]
MASILYQGIELSVARYVEQVITLLTPIVLVRTIGVTAFGEYRLFWLLVTTAAMVFPLGLPRSLLFFFVRLDSEGRRLYVGQTVLFLVATTMIAVLLIFVAGDALPAGMKELLSDHELLLAVFLFAWNLGLLLDVLPNATGQIRWQAQAILATSIVRAALTISAAVFFQRLEDVLVATLIAAFMRLGLLAYFIARYCGARLLPLDKQQFREQLRYGIPFGVATLLFNMRKQTEQWIVATVFSPGVFGIFSIATTLLMPFEVLRGVLGNLLLPRMSHLHSLGRHEELLRLNNQGNLIISAIMFPAIAALFAFSDEIIQFLFTKEYVSGSPVLRIYLVQTLISTEITTLLNVFGQGSSNLRYEASIFPFAVISSLIGVWYYGLPGAAIGSVLATFVVYALFLTRLSNVMSVPIARLQDWTNLGKLLSVSAACAVAVRFSVDLLNPSIPVAAIGGPAAVLVLYVTISLATGYRRTFAEIRREWGSIRIG